MTHVRTSPFALNPMEKSNVGTNSSKLRLGAAAELYLRMLPIRLASSIVAGNPDRKRKYA
jgi:hypothetical protein